MRVPVPAATEKQSTSKKTQRPKIIRASKYSEQEHKQSTYSVV